jgi:hypothetical protein
LLDEASLMVCKNCNTVILSTSSLVKNSKAAKVPDDWSFIQVGTTGEYDQEAFTIVGRVRLQLRNDYKNFWCGALESGKCIWLMESFASFSVLTSKWSDYSGNVSSLRSGLTISMNGAIKLTGEYVEKCEAISFEGEIANWKEVTPDFFFIQGSNPTGNTAVFTIRSKTKAEYLSGKKIEIQNLNLKNIVVWNEWKQL